MLKHFDFYYSTTTNRQGIYHSQLSPQISPFRRDTERETGAFSRLSDFDSAWPSVVSSSSEVNRKKLDSELGNFILHSTEASNVPELSPRPDHRDRENHFEDINPSSQSGAAKEDREKRSQTYDSNTRASDHQGHPGLDDTHSSNQELLSTTGGSEAPDWVINALESAEQHPHITTIPYPRRPYMFENADSSFREDSDSNEQGPTSSPPNLVSPTVPMNIRCEESALSNDNYVDRNNSRAEESSSSNNNV